MEKETTKLKVGDIVEYLDDWKKTRQWYLYKIHENDLCHIALLRNGEFTQTKHFKQGNYEWSETYLNANINNLNINKIRKI